MNLVDFPLGPDAQLTSILSVTDDQGTHHFDETVLGGWHLSVELTRGTGTPVRGLAPTAVGDSLALQLTLTNRGSSTRRVHAWRALSLSLAPREAGPGGHQLWAYCGASHEERPDWLRPVDPGFHESGWLGMNASDYGGGNAVVSVWNARSAVAVGCLSLVPEVLGLPLSRGSGHAEFAVEWSSQAAGLPAHVVAPGESLSLPPLWLAASAADGVSLLALWKDALSARGLPAASASADSREPTWCAWGYERDFTLDQVTQALPKVAELGFGWFTLDDGWQSEEGDITLNPAKFPGGEDQMRQFVADIHARGLKAMLWWIPLAADPKSRWAAQHPSTLVRATTGAPIDITWWDCHLLCPSHPEVLAETERQLRTFFLDWGFDGLKIDGQHLNAIPACHAHGHSDPEQPHRELPEFWKMVQRVSQECKPGATILFCPCGTTYNVHTMPWYDMPVSSDPSGSWQVRTKGMVFKALMAPDCAFHGDHVELSDRERDFASTVGIGGVIDTKFTWPPGSSNPSVLKPGGNFDLHPQDEVRLRSWLHAFRTQALDRATYTLGLYRFGFEPIEVHVLDAGERWYYSCFAVAGEGEDSLSARWTGRLELRGLPPGTWKVTSWAEGDRVVERPLGTLDASHSLELDVTGSQLLRLDRVESL